MSSQDSTSILTRPLNRVLLSTALWLTCLLSSYGSWAAVQGTAGPTSNANVNINLVTGLNVRISGFADMALGTWSGTGIMAANDDICIGRTGVALLGTGSYRILARGDGEPGDPAAFTLTNGATLMHYNAFFNDATGLVNRQQLTAGLQLTSQTGLGFWQIFNYLFGCVQNNANLSIEVPESELGAAAGNYAGTLTLVLIPE